MAKVKKCIEVYYISTEIRKVQDTKVFLKHQYGNKKNFKIRKSISIKVGVFHTFFGVIVIFHIKT